MCQSLNSIGQSFYLSKFPLKMNDINFASKIHFIKKEKEKKRQSFCEMKFSSEN